MSRLRLSSLALALSCSLCAVSTTVSAEALNLSFNDGVGSWRVVLDGVMGGRSSGRVQAVNSGELRFTGDLSLENNGGFSQIRTAVRGDQFADADGIELRVKGDGRKYTFDIRCSNVRMMAGGFQRDFQTVKDEWTTIQIPFDEFRLYSFGRRVARAPQLNPAKIESIGITLADKNPGAFAIDVDTIRTFGATASSGGSASLADVATSAGLTTLLQLVELSEIELPSDGPLTILAPTNDAFAALDEDTVTFLTSKDGRSLLQTILAHHVIRGNVDSGQLLNSKSATSLANQRLDVSPTGRVADAQLKAVDVAFDGGVVHVIDTVLIPETDSIETLARNASQLSTLIAAIDTAGLGAQLNNDNGPFTVFAPVDAAFQELPEGVVADLLKSENRQQLLAVLGLHVVPGRIYSNELLANRSAATYFGIPIEFSLGDDALRVNGATIVAADIEAANGVIHLVDSVLLPEAPQANAIVATPNTDEVDATVLRLLEEAVTIGAPLFNNGDRAACAAVYALVVDSILSLSGSSLDSTSRERLMRARDEAERHSSPTDKAWALRRGMDDVFTTIFRRQQTGAIASSR